MTDQQTAAPRRSRTGNLVAPLRHGSFRLLFAGQVVSRTGDVVFQVGLVAYALQHGRPALLAYSLLAQSCGAIAMLLVGGALADRFGARGILISADAARLLAVVGACALVATENVSAVPMAACALLLGLGDAAFEPAFTVAFMELLPGDDLLAANSLQSMVLQIASIGGAGLGGAVVAFGSHAMPMAFDALTFAASLGCVVAARRWPRRTPQESTHLLHGITEGARYVRSQRWLLTALIGFGIHVAFLLAPVKVLVPLAVQERLHQGGAAYSLLLAATGAGALIGGVLLGSRQNVHRPGLFIFLMMAVTDLGFTVVAVSPWLLLSAAVSLVGGASMAMAIVIWASLMQRNVPPTMLGRVSSFDWLISVSAAPVALALVPKLTSEWSATSLLLVLSLFTAAACLLMLLFPHMRSLTWLGQSEKQNPECSDG